MMISSEKISFDTVKYNDSRIAEAACYQSVTKYFIIISALLLTFMIANIMIAPNTAYIKSSEGNNSYINFTDFPLYNDDVCTSADCVQAAARLSSYMDSNINPCEDFYHYSCGGWEDSHTIPSEQGHWDIFGELAQKNYDYFLDFLSQMPNPNDSDAIVKAKRMFVACNNTEQIVKDELQAISYLINITGGWNRTNVTQNKTWSINSNLPLERYYGSGAFFGFSVRPDDYNSTKADIMVCCCFISRP